MKRNTLCRLTMGLMMAAACAPAHAGIPFPAVERPETGLPEGLQLPGKAAKRAPMGLPKRVAPEGKVLQGYQNQAVYGVLPGIYRMNTDGEQELLFIDDYTMRGYSLNTGWMREGRLCVTAELSIFDIVDYRYLEVDPYTGEVFSDTEVPLRDPVTGFVNYLPAYWSSAYDTKNDRLYGYTSSENGQGYAFFSAPGNDPSQTELVYTPGYKEICVSLAFNPEDGKLYGINRNDELVTIDTATGEQTFVMPTGLDSRYAIAGMLYVPETGKFILESLEVDYTYRLMELDLSTKTFTTLCYFDTFEQYPFLYMTDAAGDPAPIRQPEVDGARFNHAELSGTVSYFLPSEYFAGGQISGSLNWHALLNGAEYASGTSQAGDVLDVEFKDIPTGDNLFSLYVEQEGKLSAISMYTAFVGYDEPKAPESITFTEERIEWAPVTRCVNGGYLDVAELKYHVYVNDEEVGVTSDCFFDYTLPEDAPYAAYIATVSAENHGLMSGKVRSESIVMGKPWKPGFTIVPTPAQASVCSVFDLNQDVNYWGYIDEDDDNPGKGYFASPRGQGTASNDWLFLPPMDLDDADAIYEVTYEMGNFSTWYPDMELGVYLNNALDPREVAVTISEKRAINNTKQFDKYTQLISIPEAGTYYLTFFTDAGPYESGIRVRNISLKKLVTDTELPAGISNLQAEGAAKGELKVDLKFDMPKMFVSGNQIPADSEVVATVTIGEESNAFTGAPGAHMAVSVPSRQGFNRVEIVTSVGEGNGQSAVVDVFTGVDVPGPVGELTGYVTEDNMSIVASWTAPAESENGYYIDPDDVVYNLMEYGDEGWEVVQVLGKQVYEYTYTFPAGSKLATARFGIAPSTVEGICSTVAWLTDALGAPHAIPAKEEFENASYNYGPIRIIRLDDNYTDAEWGVVNPRLLDLSMECESNVACYGRSEGPSQRGMLMLPKFDLQNASTPGIVFDCWTGNAAADVTIYGETFDSDGFVTLGKFPLNGSGWQEVAFPFPDGFAGKKWVGLYIDAYFPTENHYALFSSYEVRDGVVASVASVGNDGWIRGGRGEIVIEGLEGETAYVWSLDGRLVAEKRISDGRESLAVAGGTYIVRVAGEAVKVLVR